MFQPGVSARAVKAFIKQFYSQNMASNIFTECDSNGRLHRPFWPYTSWSESKCGEIQSPSDNKTDTEESQKSSEDDTELMEEPDHWLDDLDDGVSGSCPIRSFLDLIESPDISSTPEAEEIRSDIVNVLEKTLQALSRYHKIFKGSYIMPVGSMTEHSKIYKVDEFDFAVILPALAEIDIFSLLLRKDSIKKDLDINEIVRDLSEECNEEVILNFAKYLKQLWSTEMLCHATSKWEIQDTSCYSDDVSVAGTFHLKNNSDNSVVDLDVCFWVPLNNKILSSAPDELEQKDYLFEHCLDKNGLVYAILPRDEGIEFSLNSIRFAMSCLEKETLLQYGPENNRLKCFRFCKCIVSRLVPKFQKREGCSYCFENIISSYCLKNIVLYLADAYKSDKLWTNEQIPNRVVEVFAILSLCMKVNFMRVSAYFAPYEIQINRTFRFCPGKKCVIRNSCKKETKPCLLPKIKEISCKIGDEISERVLADYEAFLEGEEWSFAEVICRLTEVMSVLRTEDKNEREEMGNNQGWNSYGLY